MDSQTPPRHVPTCDCRACEKHGCGVFGPQRGGSAPLRVVPAPKRVRKQLRRELVALLLRLRAERKESAA